MIEFFEDGTEELPVHEAKQVALRFIVEAWQDAVYEGLDSDCIASAAIFAALSDMVQSYGEEAVAQMCEGLGKRVRSGEFTVITSKQ